MLIRTDAIVLRIVRYDDHRSIVTLYTESDGLLTFSIRRKVGPAKVKGMISPLAVLNVVADIRDRHSIHHPKELSPAWVYQSIPYHPLKGSVLLFFNELFVKVLKEEEPNKSLFSFLVQVLKELDTQDPLSPGFHLVVMMQLSKYLGFYPQMGVLSSEKVFDFREGCFVDPPIMHNDYLDRELSEKMNELIALSFENYQQFRTSRAERNRLLDACIHFYGLHVAGFGSMKSPDVLRLLFD